MAQLQPKSVARRNDQRPRGKPEIAARIAWSGAGLRLKTATPTPTAVRTAVRTVLEDNRYRTRAQSSAASMSRAGGMTALTRIVDDLTAITRAAGED